jgi:hypothetical protein
MSFNDTILPEHWPKLVALHDHVTFIAILAARYDHFSIAFLKFINH